MFLNQLYQKLVSLPLKFLVSSKIIPDNPIDELAIDTQSPIYYVLQRRSTSSFLMLQQAAKKLNLPTPQIMPRNTEKIENGTVFFLQSKAMFGLGGKPVKKYQQLLEKLIHEQQHQHDVNHQLIPVSIYWGRNPGKEKSLLRLLFTDTESATVLRKFFLFLFQGRNSFVRIAKPVNLQTLTNNTNSNQSTATKLTRTLRVHFQRYRRAAMGPLLTERRHVISSIVNSDIVKNAIEREARAKNTPATKVKLRAEKYAKEIASDYSYKMIRISESLLTHFWNKIYDGVEVHNAEMVRQLAATHEVIYLPCHRSHIDYLLLSYTLYHEGLVPPHIAAGINLNFWPIGPILRRCGAFFLRRSFGGNKLYTAVFNEYIFQLMDRNTPIKFFPEGGRSRTGRLLHPKTGLLAMSVQACLRGLRKPVAIIPVYIGYERIFEGKSYLRELRGGEKQKESFGQLLSIRKTIKKSFGKVYLNFATPVILNEYLDEKRPDWHKHKGEVNAKPGWLTPEVTCLANELLERINASATLCSVNLVALILLSTERIAIDKKELENQLELLLFLGNKARYSKQTLLPKESPAQLINRAQKAGIIYPVKNPMGEIVSTDEKTAILLTYYRNNILHLFITPALIASHFLNQQTIHQKHLVENLQLLYPFLKKELFLHWNDLGFKAHIEQHIEAMIDCGLLLRQDEQIIKANNNQTEFTKLLNLAEIASPTLLRYGIILTLLSTHAGKGNIQRQVLESRSQQLAQRIAGLYSLNAPEAFDKSLFRNMVSVLKDNDLIQVEDNNSFSVSGDLNQLHHLILNNINIHARQMLQKTANWADQFWESNH
ncbi:glycerol-3-phosphate 1-O-acyltransferase PlsB [Aliikangiella maris]|uniref:Glycerol-3-phosphate 1-O-acyltransferase PlsB n=2 Tax=Aliikangiella maris TaxID=3162458 RepID=A0ABV2BUL3_9GAMM